MRISNWEFEGKRIKFRDSRPYIMLTESLRPSGIKLERFKRGRGGEGGGGSTKAVMNKLIFKPISLHLLRN